MELTSELKQRAIKTVREYTDVANRNFGTNIPMPSVKFDKRGTTAGTANYARHEVNLNAGLFVRNVDDFLKTTVPHEVAHLVAFQVYQKGRGRSISAHGSEWKNVMYIFGVPANRCHSYDVSEVKQHKTLVRISYKCGCKTHEVTNATHKKIQAGHTYRCRLCKQSLVLATTAVKPVAAPIVKAPVVKAPKLSAAVGSKKERSLELYAMYMELGREMIIAMFMQELDMTKAGASTYYANAKKAFGG